MPSPEWIVSNGLVDYNDAMVAMDKRVADIKNGKAGDLIWCLQHPSTYTAGTGMEVVTNAPNASAEPSAPPPNAPNASATAPDTSRTSPNASANSPNNPNASANPPDTSRTSPNASAPPPNASATPPDTSRTSPNASATPPDTSRTSPNASATPPINIIASGRGGQTTWHGPGQRVCYVMMDITAHQLTAHDYVQRLLAWAGLALKTIGIETFIPDGKDKIGLWVKSPYPSTIAPSSAISPTTASPHPVNKTPTTAPHPTIAPAPPTIAPPHPTIANKICAIGVRLSPSRLTGRPMLVASHGIAINLCPLLPQFDAIVPCGIADKNYGVTSAQALGNHATMDMLDDALKSAWQKIW